MIISKARQARLNYSARLGRTVSVQEAAETLGVDRKRLTQIEQGKMERIDTETLEKMCKLYGVTVGELLVYTVEDVVEKNRKPQLVQVALPV